MNVWDTPGGDEFAHMRDLDYEGADACIMVYCIDKETTFNEMQGLKELASKFCNPLFFLVGNKVDLDAAGERLVDKVMGRELKDDLGLTHFVETNANAADHVQNLFNRVRDELIKQEENIKHSAN